MTQKHHSVLGYLISQMFVILALFVFFSPKSIQAQNPFCYPDCDTTYWIPNTSFLPLTYLITLPCGETVRVAYRYGYSCNGWFDLFLVNVVFLNGRYGGELCGQTMTTAGMIDNITQQLLFKDPMNFPPTDTTRDTCYENYRVNLSSCWSTTFPVAADSGATHGLRSTDNYNDPGVMEPCVSIECCIQLYMVCIINHKKVVTYDVNRSHPGICDPEQPPFCTPVCY